MLGDRSQRASYRNVDDLSDSDEMDMDISDSGEGDWNSAEPPTKRARTNTSSVNPAQDAPKWSNPDPYTALPPPETTGRKKDVVQLIRKARVEAEAQKPALSTEAAEFISCDISDDEATDKVQYEHIEAGANATEDLPVKHGRTHVSNGADALGGPGGSSASSAPAAPHNLSNATLPPKPPVSAFSQVSRPAEHLAKTQVTQYNHTQHTQTQSSQSFNSAKQSGRKSAPVDLTPSTSLGNRKRTIDDEIKLPHAPLKKVNRMASRGRIVPVWESEPGEDPCPWALVDHSATPSAGTR
jgi:non-canonical poly(A) RNA polymerase PAPD5/7